MTNTPPSGGNLRGAVDLSSLVRPAVDTTGSSAGDTAGAKSSGVVRSANDAGFADVLTLSSTVPVIVEFYGQGVAPGLASVIESYGGRLVLVTVDAASNPQLVQAFQVQQLPTVAAVVAERPLQLFAGSLPDTELRGVLEQVLQVAAQNKVTGTVPNGDAGVVEEPEEVPLPPHHQEAYDALEKNDFATAISEFETAIAQNPRDSAAVAGLAQVSLLARMDGVAIDDVRATAADRPDDVDAQLAVTDVDMSGGNLDDAFSRLLELFSGLDVKEKNRVRTRLLDYFEIAGTDDERVVAARKKLTLLLY